MTVEIPIIENVITVHPEQTVEEAIQSLEKARIRYAPVIDEEGVMLGMFSLNRVLENLLPISVRMQDGMQNIDFIIGAAPGAGKRLLKMLPRPVREVMDSEYHVIRPTMPSLETIRLLVTYGSPLPVVDEKTGKLLGIVSEQEAVAQLLKMAEG